MISIPRFLTPQRHLVKLYRIIVGTKSGVGLKRLQKKFDIFSAPLPIVYLLAETLQKHKHPLSPRLRGVLSHMRFSNAFSMSAFERALGAFGKSKIPTMPQKGLVAKIQNPHIVRPMNDADFAVPTKQYRRAIDTAVDAGFTLQFDMLGSADLQYRDMGRIDIHNALFKGGNPRMGDVIWKRAIHTKYQNHTVYIPCPADHMVMIMCEFYGNYLYECADPYRKIARQFAQHPMWVLDARDIILQNPNLDWAQIINTAELSGYGYQIRLLAQVLNKIFPHLVSKSNLRIMKKICPDTDVLQKIIRDKKIIKMHELNSKWFEQQLKDGNVPGCGHSI